MGCPSSEEPSSRSTRHWCWHCVATGARDVTQHSEMESLWRRRADGRSVLTRNSGEKEGEQGSSSSRLTLAGGGRVRPSISPSWLPTRSPGQLLRPCVERLELHGSVALLLSSCGDLANCSLSLANHKWASGERPTSMHVSGISPRPVVYHVLGLFSSSRAPLPVVHEFLFLV